MGLSGCKELSRRKGDSRVVGLELDQRQVGCWRTLFLTSAILSKLHTGWVHSPGEAEWNLLGKYASMYLTIHASQSSPYDSGSAVPWKQWLIPQGCLCHNDKHFNHKARSNSTKKTKILKVIGALQQRGKRVCYMKINRSWLLTLYNHSP